MVWLVSNSAGRLRCCAVLAAGLLLSACAQAHGTGHHATEPSAVAVQTPPPPATSTDPFSSDPTSSDPPSTDPTSSDPPATVRSTGPPATTARASQHRPSTPPSPKPSRTRQSTVAATHVPPGRVVVLDPGHNGGNASHTDIINAPVPDGNGSTKPCNTTGTATNAGYAEHAFNWDVAMRVRSILRGHGITVVLTRQNDSGVGPCVDKRAQIGNAAQATAVVSIHGDGSWSGHGFHVITATKDRGTPAVDEASSRLAHDVHAQMLADSGMSTATYIGSDGYDRRSDLAGLNLSDRPTIMVECGNMRDAGDAAIMSSVDGRSHIAVAIANGISAFLDGR